MLNATDDLWRAVRGFAAGEPGSVVLGYGTSSGYGRIAAVREYMDAGYAHRTAFGPRR